jgi:hypothetical protein
LFIAILNCDPDATQKVILEVSAYPGHSLMAMMGGSTEEFLKDTRALVSAGDLDCALNKILAIVKKCQFRVSIVLARWATVESAGQTHNIDNSLRPQKKTLLEGKNITSVLKSLASVTLHLPGMSLALMPSPALAGSMSDVR